MHASRVFSDGLLATAILLGTSLGEGEAAEADWRFFDAGRRIHSSGYIDQPYVVVLDDGTWLCVFTTGVNKEGAAGQHVVASRSQDRGKTWSAPVDIEPADGPAASWAMPFRTDAGRVYAFYTYNGDRIETLRGQKIRNDVLGWYCFRYSDNGGITWSARHRIPLPKTMCDRGNDFGGEVQLFWGIDKADRVEDAMMFAFTKLGKYMLEEGEGWFLRCENIHTQRDARKLDWRLLPEGEKGVRNPDFGSVQEEHNMVPLPDGSLYCVYRTTLGYPAESYSRDGGRSWSEPRRIRYADGTLLKNPRACPRLFLCDNGKLLLWYHHHSGTGYEDRNPAWIAGAIAPQGRVLWSQPEIVVYSHDTSRATGRFSYPDLIEEKGRYWLTCTNKEVARLREIPAALVEGLWGQLENDGATRPTPAPVLSRAPEQIGAGTLAVDDYLTVDPNVDGGGFTIAMTVDPDDLKAGQYLLDGRDAEGRGVAIRMVEIDQLELILAGTEGQTRWSMDPGMLEAGRTHRVVVTVDNGPRIIMWIVDGRMADGGEHRQFGWTRYDRAIGLVDGAAELDLTQQGLRKLAIFERPLTTSEAVAVTRGDR